MFMFRVQRMVLDSRFIWLAQGMNRSSLQSALIDSFRSGGKAQAPLISDDPDWRTILAQLQASVVYGLGRVRVTI
jgi:hypothetical protein